MTRSVSARRSAKPSRPAYVLDEQIGFIRRQVWQRHATIFAREIGINLTPTQWAAWGSSWAMALSSSFNASAASNGILRAAGDRDQAGIFIGVQMKCRTTRRRDGRAGRWLRGKPDVLFA